MKPQNKRELAEALLQGRTFRCQGTHNKSILHFDDTKSNPFRYGTEVMRGVWNEVKRITEILPWYENIPSEGVLCWVSNYQSKPCAEVTTIHSYLPSKDRRFLSDDDTYKYAVPVKPSECFQGELK